jgi:hypothetical protein
VVSNRPGGHRFAVRVAWRALIPEEVASRGSAPGIEIRIEIRKSKGVMQAMLQMDKLDIAQLKEAYDKG